MHPFLIGLALLAAPETPDFIDLLTAADNPVGARLSPRAGGDYDATWLIQHRKGPAVYYTAHRGILSRGGALSGVRLLGQESWRVLARRGEQLIAVSAPNNGPPKGWRAQLVFIGPKGVTARVDLPSQPRGRDQMRASLAWDPKHEEWGVAWQLYFDLDPKRPGYVHGEIFFGRLSPEGAWRDVRPITAVTLQQSASLSDRAASLIWDGQGFALLWLLHTQGSEEQLYLSRIDEVDARHTLIDSARRIASRAALVANSEGTIGIAWAREVRVKPRPRSSSRGAPMIQPSPPQELDRYALQFARLRGVKLSPAREIGHDVDGTHLASDGRGFMVAWSEHTVRGDYIRAARIHPKTGAAKVAKITAPQAGLSDWVSYLFFDRGAYVLGSAHGINPSQHRIYFLQP